MSSDRGLITDADHMQVATMGATRPQLVNLVRCGKRHITTTFPYQHISLNLQLHANCIVHYTQALL